MNSLLLVGMSVSVLYVIHAILKVAFCLIEKAHEHLRETERRTLGAELVKGSGG